MTGRKRHRKKAVKWAKQARARALLPYFESGVIYMPDRRHSIDPAGSALTEIDLWGWIASGAPGKGDE